MFFQKIPILFIREKFEDLGGSEPADGGEALVSGNGWVGAPGEQAFVLGDAQGVGEVVVDGFVDSVTVVFGGLAQDGAKVGDQLDICEAGFFMDFAEGSLCEGFAGFDVAFGEVPGFGGAFVLGEGDFELAVDFVQDDGACRDGCAARHV